MTAVGQDVEPVIRIHLAELMARHRVSNEALAETIGLSPNQLSRLKNGDVAFIRLSTMAAICRELRCQPGELLSFEGGA